MSNSAATKTKTRLKTEAKVGFMKVVTELLFTILPFVVAAIVLSYRGTTSHLFFIPEWAIAATVLQGQALVKFISVLFLTGRADETKIAMSAGGLIFTLLLMICFVPTVLLLVFVFLSETLSATLAVMQVMAFVVAVVVFFVVASVMEVASEPQTTTVSAPKATA